MALPNYPMDPNTGKPLIKPGVIPAGGLGSQSGTHGYGQVSVPWFSPEENRRISEYGAGASASGQFTAPSLNIDFDDPFFSPMPGATKSTKQLMDEMYQPGMDKQTLYQQARAQSRAPDVSFQQGAWHYGLSPDMQQQLTGMTPGLNPLTGRPEVQAALPPTAVNAADWQIRQPYQRAGETQWRQQPLLHQMGAPAAPPPLGGPSALPRMAAPTTTRDLTAAYSWADANRFNPATGRWGSTQSGMQTQPPPTQPGGTAPPPVFVPPPPPGTQPQPVTAGPAPTQAPPPGK